MAAFLFLFFFFVVNGVQLSSLSLNPQKVDVSVYFETLNSNSTHFIVSNLYQTFNNKVISITNIKLVPWGNARIDKSNGAIICENGPDECLLNAVVACAIDHWGNVNTYYQLIHDIELLVIEGKHKEWQTCFEKLGLHLNPVLDCINSGNGTKLGLEYAKTTAALVRRQTLLPWVVVNNQPIKEDYKNYTAYVCKAYKGKLVSGCSSLSRPILPVF